MTALNRHQNFAIRISAALAVYEAAHNSGGGDAPGNAAFAPRLPLKPCTAESVVILLYSKSPNGSNVTTSFREDSGLAGGPSVCGRYVRHVADQSTTVQ